MPPFSWGSCNRSWPYWSYIVQNALYFFKKYIFFTPGQRLNKAFSNDEQGLWKIWISGPLGQRFSCYGDIIAYSNFMIPGVMGSCARVWPIWSLKSSKKIAKFDPGYKDLNDLGHKSVYILCFSCRCPLRHVGLLFIFMHMT